MVYYIGFCPVCGEGALGIRTCAAGTHAVVLCDECDAMWLTTDVSLPASFPEQPEVPCPHCGATLVAAAAHWATSEEIARAGWQHAVIGRGPALGEDAAERDARPDA